MHTGSRSAEPDFSGFWDLLETYPRIEVISRILRDTGCSRTAVYYKYLYEERPKQWRILIGTSYRIRQVTLLEGQGRQGPR